MSNDTPPHACLADFGFMTIVLDPGQLMSCCASLEGGTLTFMSPELLLPSKFGMKDSIPTPEADIYAFGLVTFQAHEQDFDCRLFFLFRPGPYRQNPISWPSESGAGVLRGLWVAPGQTRGRSIYRIF